MSAGIPIVKMSGAGNDFVVVGPDGVRRLGRDPRPWVRAVCRRGLSVGADGVLFVTPAGPGRVAVRFLNPDGSEAFCGNGSRCAARYAVRAGFAERELTLITTTGDVPARVRGDGVRLTLPAPRLLETFALDDDGTPHDGRFIDAGTLHLVVVVPDAAEAPLERWGPRWRRDPRLGPGGANVNVLSLGPGAAHLRTWERGVEGETLACGSAAVAAALVARAGGAGERIRLLTKGGAPLVVELPGAPQQPDAAVLEGDARFVFVGETDVEATCGS